jgi:hypothetical protein
VHARRLSIALIAVFTCFAAPARADTTTFVFTGTEKILPVPAGVTSLHVVAIGGRGGDSVGALGGNGGKVTADLPVTPGTLLFVEVGGNGSAGGFNGGGAGGSGFGGGAGGTGGGASDVRLVSRAGTATLVSRLLVAAGGGGGGGQLGAAGGNADAAGQDTTQPSIRGGGPGNALGIGAGGSGGFGGASGSPGFAGAGGPGGDGGNTGGGETGGGGGGGGGSYGGGGGGGGGSTAGAIGAIGGGGGGGGSYVPPGVSATFTVTTEAPSVTVSFERPALTVPGEVAFPGTQLTGSVSGPLPVTLRNDGGAPLALSGISPAGDFLVDAGACMAPLSPGASCTLLVRFTPSVAGARAGSLTIASNDPAGPSTVALAGTGVVAAPAVQGPKGDPGPQGAPGRDAALPIVTCTTKRKKTTCTTTLAKLASGARVTLFRSGRAVATGRVARGGRVKLTAQRRLAAGTYALRAVRGSREQRVVVTVRRV